MPEYAAAIKAFRHPLSSIRPTKKQRQPFPAASDNQQMKERGAKTYRPKRPPPRFPALSRAGPGSGKKVGHHAVENRTGAADHRSEAELFEGSGFRLGFHGAEKSDY